MKVYEREVDGSHGAQVLIFIDGKCVKQYIETRDYGGGYYTGDGNPEFVGRTTRAIGMKRNGFKRVYLSDFLKENIYSELDEEVLR